MRTGTLTRARAGRPDPRSSARRRRLVAVAGLLLLLAAAVVVSLAVGTKPVPLHAVWTALTAPTGAEDDVLVRGLRVPRTLLGVEVGVALGVAGALMQGHTRNPLAEPGLLGVSAGSAFLVVVGIVVLGITGTGGLAVLAFVGALLASVLVFQLGATGGGGRTPVTLTLAGVAVTFLLRGLTSALVLSDTTAIDLYRFWTVGSLTGRLDGVGLQIAPLLIVGLGLAALNAPALNTLALGDDLATGLGQDIRTARWTGLAAITLLAGSAVVAAGPIAFVGLMVPHLARRLTGPDHRWSIPVAGLTGAVLTLVADVLGRLVARPGEVEVGIVLALVGAPFFIMLVRHQRLVTA